MYRGHLFGRSVGNTPQECPTAHACSLHARLRWRFVCKGYSWNVERVNYFKLKRKRVAGGLGMSGTDIRRGWAVIHRS